MHGRWSDYYLTISSQTRQRAELTSLNDAFLDCEFVTHSWISARGRYGIAHICTFLRSLLSRYVRKTRRDFTILIFDYSCPLQLPATARKRETSWGIEGHGNAFRIEWECACIILTPRILFQSWESMESESVLVPYVLIFPGIFWAMDIICVLINSWQQNRNKYAYTVFVDTEPKVSVY